MKNMSNGAAGAGNIGSPSADPFKGPTRRKLFGQVGATFAAGMIGRDAVAFGQSGRNGDGAGGARNIDPPGAASNSRVHQSFALRLSAARNEAQIPVPPHTTN